MKKIGVIACLLSFFSMTVVWGQEDIKEWRIKKEIVLQEENTQYKGVLLDKETYKYSKQDLSDIRIIDDTGEFVPYYIENRYDRKTETELYSYTAERIFAFEKKEDTFFDFELYKEEEDKDFLVDQLDLDMDLGKNFAKEISVFGSYDNEKWEFIQTDNLYNIVDKGNTKTSVYFEKDKKYAYYRIGILKNPDGLTKDGLQVEGIHAVKRKKSNIEKELYEKEEEVEPFIAQGDKQTIVKIKNPDRVRIFGLELVSPDTFYREYTLESQEGYIYNKGFLSNEENKNRISIYDTYDERDFKELTLTIENKDDKPIQIDKVLVRYSLDKVVFKAEPSHTYSMLLGNEKADRPEYDIALYKDKIEEEPQEKALFGETIKMKQERTDVGEKVNMQLILNVVVVIISVFLMLLIFKGMKKEK